MCICNAHFLILCLITSFCWCVSDTRVEIIDRDNLWERSAAMSCPGHGPFSSLGECFILCADTACSNAVEACGLMRADCKGIVRSSAGIDEDLAGQLVELVSVSVDKDPSSQQLRSCFEYGRQLETTELGRRVASYDIQNRKCVSRFTSGNGTIMFLHFRKSGGSTLCRYMIRKKISTPPVVPLKFAVRFPFVGKNCNPSFLGALQAWFGTAEQQVRWADRYSFQFFENELYLPQEHNIPFDKFLLGTQMRHPSARLYSLFRENRRYQICPITDYKGCSLNSLKLQPPEVASAVIENYNKNAVPWVNHGPNRSNYLIPGGKFSPETRHSAPCSNFSSTAFSEWLGNTIRSQDVAYFAGMNHADESSRMRKGRAMKMNEQQFKRDSAAILQIKILQAGIRGVDYNREDLKYALSVLEKFSFVSILEGINWILPAVLSLLRFSEPSDLSRTRSGTKHTCGLLAHISHDKQLIQRLLAVSNLDFELYAHAMKVACIKYYRISELK